MSAVTQTTPVEETYSVRVVANVNINLLVKVDDANEAKKQVDAMSYDELLKRSNSIIIYSTEEIDIDDDVTYEEERLRQKEKYNNVLRGLVTTMVDNNFKNLVGLNSEFIYPQNDETFHIKLESINDNTHAPEFLLDYDQEFRVVVFGVFDNSGVGGDEKSTNFDNVILEFNHKLSTPLPHALRSDLIGNFEVPFEVLDENLIKIDSIDVGDELIGAELLDMPDEFLDDNNEDVIPTYDAFTFIKLKDGRKGLITTIDLDDSFWDIKNITNNENVLCVRCESNSELNDENVCCECSRTEDFFCGPLAKKIVLLHNENDYKSLLMDEVFVIVFDASDGYQFDIYMSIDDLIDEEICDGGTCTSSFSNAIEMAEEQAVELYQRIKLNENKDK
ncbi:MAG: hypothetical protein COB67_02290 [SAR324 cluster bacterium]|uniref:Uncharacterized protein n=1 Tax=SAR324 cluster bacterium TaxID=2024889 RepID=A0A2A4TAI3_9DELT|nr:MAG: hypothetical protein COB67_02290 [SAR324 cluster bacterium]